MVRASWLKRTSCDVHRNCLHYPMKRFGFVDGGRGYCVGERAFKCELKVKRGFIVESTAGDSLFNLRLPYFIARLPKYHTYI